MNEMSGVLEPSAPRSASEILCSNLSLGLHAAAQPLSILRASLGNDQIVQMDIDELKKVAASSAVEVERVCVLFSSLKQLVGAASVKPRLTAMPIVLLLAEVTDGVNLLFEKDGMFLRATVPDGCPLVLIDKAKTLQALSIVLLIAQGLSRAKDTVELNVSSSYSDTVRVVVQNENSNSKAMSADAKLRMALAEANIRIQQAGFSWSLQPFSVQIDFQKALAVRNVCL